MLRTRHGAPNHSPLPPPLIHTPRAPTLILTSLRLCILDNRIRVDRRHGLFSSYNVPNLGGRERRLLCAEFLEESDGPPGLRRRLELSLILRRYTRHFPLLLRSYSGGHASNTAQDQSNKIQTSVIKTMILVSGLYTVTLAPIHVYSRFMNFSSHRQSEWNIPCDVCRIHLHLRQPVHLRHQV